LKKLAKKKTAPKGHWPPGKRRNPDLGDWTRTLLSVQTLLCDHYKVGVRSPRALALAINVDPHSVLKWLDGTHRPAPEHQLAIKGWLNKQLKEITNI
jgi:hypothetical protein